jgi:hypothetical protein
MTPMIHHDAMSDLWQGAIPVIPAAVTVLVAYQGALSSTGRLRRNIKVDVDLLAALPADHPSRPVLEAHIAELLDRLIRRERRQFGSIVPAGTWSFVFTVAVGVALGTGLIFLADGAMCPRRQCLSLTEIVLVNLLAAALFVALRTSDYVLDWLLGRRQRRPDSAADR